MSCMVSHLIARTLREYGTPYVTGIPGHGNWALIDGLNEPASELPFVQVMHEQSATHMADAHYRLTGQPVAVMASIGPGAANTIHGLAAAYSDSSALLMIAGSAATHMRGHGVMQALDRGYVPDFPRLAEPVTKETFDLVEPDMTASILHRAFSAMLTGRPGPVAIDVPLDQQVATTSIGPQELSLRLPTGRTRPDANAVESALRLLIESERPCVIAGGGLLQARGSDSLLRLAERLGLPVAFTWNGKGAIAENHPLCAGPIGVSGSRAANAMVADADVVLALGCRFTDWSASSFRKGVTFSIPPSRLIHVDIDPAVIGRSYPVEVGIVADVTMTLEDLLAGVSDQQSRTVRSRHQGHIETMIRDRQEWEKVLDLRRHNQTWPGSMLGVLQVLRETLPHDGIVTVGSGHCQGAVKQAFPVYEPGTHITSGGFSSMGFAVPAALAARIARPDVPVVCIVGDGDMLMSIHELTTCITMDLGVIFLVLNNSGFMSIRDGQEALYGRSTGSEFRLRRRPGDVRYTADFVSHARAFGIDHAARPDDWASLRRALRDALNHGGSAVIDVPVALDPAVAAAEPAGWWDFPPAPSAKAEIRNDYSRGRAAEQHLGADTSQAEIASPLGIYG